MPSVKIIEIVSGLGLGGAEKAFLNRLKYQPEDVETVIVNSRPKLIDLKLPITAKFRDISLFRFDGIYKIRQLIVTFKPDVIVIRSPLDLILCFPVIFFSSKCYKIVFEAHLTVLSPKKIIAVLMKPFFRMAMKRVDLTLAVSQSVAKADQCSYSKAIEVIILGADIAPSFNGPTVSRSGVNFIFVGRLMPVKNPSLLLAAILNLKDEFRSSRSHLKILGKGALFEDVKNYILENELSDIVELMGAVEDVTSYLESSDYLISTSWVEGQPIAFFEAKLCGVRIIATPSTPFFEVFGSEDTMLSSFEVNDLIEALKFAINNGPISTSERASVAKSNARFAAKNTSAAYYSIIRNLS